MKPLIAIVTALHVLAHGMFGCCDEKIYAAASDVHEFACHHAHHDHDAEDSSGSVQLFEAELPVQTPHECIHDSCHWVVGDSMQELTLQDAPLSAIGVVTTLHAIEATQAVYLLRNLGADFLAAPPVRLHLALGVILV